MIFNSMSKTVYKNKYINIIEENDIVQIENIHGGSVVLPVTKDNNVILLEIYRDAINQISLEAPRGFSEEGEEPVETAGRELYEELHCTCEKLVPLGLIYPDTGLQKAGIYLYLGINTKIQDEYVQTEEKIKKIMMFPFKEVYQKAMNCEINDSFTLAAIFRSLKYFTE